MKRREFIEMGAAAGGSFLLPAQRNLSEGRPSFASAPGFQLILLATNWGFAGTADDFCKRVKKEGYDGVEIWWPVESPAQDEWFSALDRHQLQAGFLCGGWQSKWQEHLDTFRSMTEAAAHNKRQRPLYINCHSGRDYFTPEQNQTFIDHTRQLAQATGIRICHETHRSRMMFAAPLCRHYLEKNPDLKLTFDVSHWCNVHESLLQDQGETLDLVLERVEHIHARIGHAEGPQVSDPRAPEWKDALQAHLRWWDKVLQRKKAAGEPMTILTEFGPADYMPTVPYTHQPLADQWAVNVHMMHLLRERYV